MMTSKCLCFFSWKREEDCCGAAGETVSMRGWRSVDETICFNTELWSLDSRAPPKASSPDAVKQQMASQSETGELACFRSPDCTPWCHLSHVLTDGMCVQDLGMGNTAALKSISTTAVSRGLTWTRDALQNCLSSSAPETVFLCWKKWVQGGLCWWMHISNGGIHGKAIRHVTITAVVQDKQSQIMMHSNYWCLILSADEGIKN